MRAFVLTLLCAWASAVFAADGGHAGHGSSTSDGQTSGAPAGWTDLPLIEAMPGRDRSKATFRLSNLIADTVKVLLQGARRRCPMAFASSPTGRNGISRREKIASPCNRLGWATITGCKRARKLRKA